LYIGLRQEVRAYFDGRYICVSNEISGSFRILSKNAAIFIFLLKGCRKLENVKSDFFYLTNLDVVYFENILLRLSHYVYYGENVFNVGRNEIDKCQLLDAESIGSLLIIEQPQNVYIRVTNMCDKKCKYCFEREHMNLKEEGSFPAFLVEKIIHNINVEKTNFELTGGEPLLCDGFLKIIEEFGKFSVPVMMITKASGNYSYFESLLQKNVSQVCFSLDSNDKDYVNNITGCSDTFDNIVKCMEIAHKASVDIDVNAVITKNNMKDIENLVLFCIKYYVKNLHLSVVQLTGNEEKKFAPNTKESMEVYVHVGYLRKKYFGIIDIELTPAVCGKKRNCKGCGKPFTDVKIDYNGDVFLCNGQIIGNLYNQNLHDMWNDQNTKQLKTEILKQMAV